MASLGLGNTIIRHLNEKWAWRKSIFITKMLFIYTHSHIHTYTHTHPAFCEGIKISAGRKRIFKILSSDYSTEAYKYLMYYAVSY